MKAEADFYVVLWREKTGIESFMESNKYIETNSSLLNLVGHHTNKYTKFKWSIPYADFSSIY